MGLILTRSKKTISGLLTLFLSLLILLSNSSRAINAESLVWPTDDWQTAKPRQQGMDKDLLEEMISYMEDLSVTVDSVVVIRNGYLVQEGYFGLYEASWSHALWSVTKSFTCALIGAAIKEGFISNVHQKVLDFFPGRNVSNIDSRKEAMEIQHLLMMSTGMAYPGDDAIWPGWMSSDDQVQYILDLPMATEPGTIFNYDTGGTHLLSAIIQEVTGNTTKEFANQYLFGPLGITQYHWEYDRTGVYYGGHGLFMTPRDMAKLGYLYLNNGSWDGQQILPVDWVENTTSLHWSLGYNLGYGELWWLHPLSGMYTAWGRHGQHVFVIPEYDIVVVFTASFSVSDTEPYLDIIEDYILPAVQNVSISFPIILALGCTTFLLMIFIFRKDKNDKR